MVADEMPDRERRLTEHVRSLGEPVHVSCVDECGWPQRVVRRSLAWVLADTHERVHAHGVRIDPVDEQQYAQWARLPGRQ